MNAKRDAQLDWADDVARFSEDASVADWFNTVRSVFQSSAAESVSSLGWSELFKAYDTDGSGELDEEEFLTAAESNLGADFPSTDLKRLFDAVDVDKSGTIDAAEFSSWLNKQASASHGSANGGW
eukprot:SAG31_NODE_7929_length_1562_cov_3.333561_2_plen_124_part_01